MLVESEIGFESQFIFIMYNSPSPTNTSQSVCPGAPQKVRVHRHSSRDCVAKRELFPVIDLTEDEPTVFDSTDCPVCYKVISIKIIGANCGHVICSDCFNSLDSQKC